MENMQFIGVIGVCLMIFIIIEVIARVIANWIVKTFHGSENEVGNE